MTEATIDRAGEDAALAHACARGARLVARNVRTPWGELDLVFRDGSCLVFAEVKTRATSVCGAPAYAVTRHKALRYTRAALTLLQKLGLPLETECRFDVFAVIASRGGFEVEWIRSAFDAVE